MNLLELTQKVAFRSRTVPGLDQPAVLTGLTGRLARCLDWTQEAWREIQTHRPDWLWMRESFTGTLLSNTQRYEASDWGISRWSSWVVNTRGGESGWSIYKTSEGVSDERPLILVPWDRFRVLYLRGEHDTDYPQCFSLAPSGEVYLFPKPDTGYKVNGEFMRGPQALTLAADIPDLPETFHDLIVLKALALLHQSDEAAYLDPRTELRALRMMAELEANQLPAIGFAGSWNGGGPLA